MSILGQRFRDAGLQDILVESGLVEPNAVSAVLAGKHYNRGLRVHQIVMEALFRLLWKEFEAWLDKQPAVEGILTSHLKTLLDKFRRDCRDTTSRSVEKESNFSSYIMNYFNSLHHSSHP